MRMRPVKGAPIASCVVMSSIMVHLKGGTGGSLPVPQRAPPLAQLPLP